MSKHIRTTYLLFAALGIGLSPLVMAWTPYGYGPYDPGYRGGYGGQSGYPPGAQAPQAADSDAASDTAPIAPLYPDFGPGPGPSWAYPGSGVPSFGRPPGFRISRATSNDAYSLTIHLHGMSPEEVQVRAQGQSLVISRERTEQQIQKDSFDDGRGFMRSFSYSSGTSSRRLTVPRDADLSAMSREDGEESIHIRIPRHGR